MSPTIEQQKHLEATWQNIQLRSSVESLTEKLHAAAPTITAWLHRVSS